MPSSTAPAQHRRPGTTASPGRSIGDARSPHRQSTRMQRGGRRAHPFRLLLQILRALLVLTIATGALWHLQQGHYGACITLLSLAALLAWLPLTVVYLTVALAVLALGAAGAEGDKGERDEDTGGTATPVPAQLQSPRPGVGSTPPVWALHKVTPDGGRSIALMHR